MRIDFIIDGCRILLSEAEFKQILRGLTEIRNEHGLGGTLDDLWFDMKDFWDTSEKNREAAC